MIERTHWEGCEEVHPECKIARLEARIKTLEEALLVLSLIPIEDFGKEGKPDYPLMGWNHHMLYVRDVLRAREVLK